MEIPEPEFSNGHSALSIPFTRSMDHIILNVNINESREVNLIFDTGFGLPGVILFDPDLGDSLDFSYSGIVALGGGGSEGDKRAKIVSGQSLSLQGVRYRDQQILVFEEKDTKFSKLSIDGIIGGSLMGSVVEIDYNKSVLNLISTDSYQSQDEARVFPISFSAGIPVVEAELVLDDGKKPLPITLLVDTGVPDIPLLLFPFSNESIVKPVKTVKFMGEAMGGEMPIACGRVPRLRLGEFEFENVVAGYVKKEDFGSAVMLGQNGMFGHDLIQRFNVAFDYPGERLFLSPNNGFNRVHELNTAGLNLMPLRDGTMQVNSVIPDSPASEAGIVVDDIITEIDGKAVSQFEFTELRALFSQVGRNVEIMAMRAGEGRKFEFVLKRLI